MRRRTLLAVSIAAASIAAGAWVAVARGDDDSATWVEVRRDALVIAVEVNGTLRAVDSSTIGPPQLRDFWDYKISSMTPEGEEVAAGAPVLTFDSSELEQRLERQIAERDEAIKQIEKTSTTLVMRRRGEELRLEEAEARHRRAQMRLQGPEELKSAQELEVARLDLQLAELEVRQVRAKLEALQRSAEAQLAALRNQRDRADRQVAEIRQAIDDMVRRAPRAGTVVYVTNWRDEKKQVGDAVWRGETVLELPDLEQMEAEGLVDEADMGRVASGQRVQLRLDAHPDVEFTGRIRSIWRSVQSESRGTPLKVVRLDIELDETDTRRMRPGMRFRGRVEIERVADALLVPIEAVQHGPSGSTVERRTLIGSEAVRVELGRRNERQVEVLSGLAPGDAVALDRVNGVQAPAS